MENYMNEAELSSLIGIKASTLRVWRSTKKGPPFYKVEGAVRYLEDEVRAWVAARRVSHSPEDVGEAVND